MSERSGPLSWDQLSALARAGTLAPDDVVWNEALPGWVTASRMPGLFAGTRPAAPSPPPFPRNVPPPPPPAHSAPARRRHPYLPAVLIPLIALIVVGGSLAAYFLLWHGGAKPGSTASLDTTSTIESSTSSTAPGGTTTETVAHQAGFGIVQTKLPDRAKLIQTAKFGEIPGNQIVILLTEGAGDADAQRVAAAVGGSVVGRIEFVDLYQIELPGAAEAGLLAALETAKADSKVEHAGVNEQVYDNVEVWGVRQSPLSDPAYQGNNGKGCELIGVDKAWKYLKGSGLPLSGVTVGVVDSGLYTPSGEFNGEVNIKYPTAGNGPRTVAERDSTKSGVEYSDPDGSHGTAVAGIIGADGANGGQAGIASILGSYLTLSVTNQTEPPYGIQQVPADPNDPTVVTYPNGNSYAVGSMAAIIDQVRAGAKVINCSWGNRATDQSPTMAAAYRALFEKMNTEHPDVLFVCSAGNDGQARDGSQRFPSGLKLSNMITVGNVMNDGSTAASSNKKNDAAGKEYEVTMAAPGDEAVRSVDADGVVHAGKEEVAPGLRVSGGTSMAAPQVSAAAAVLLSIRPGLTAGQIKDLLTTTARPGPAELGGKTLAIDAAVLEVISMQRADLNLDPLTADQLENGGVIDAVATSIDGQPNAYSLKGILKALTSAEGTDVEIAASDGIEMDEEPVQHLDQAGEAVWAKAIVPEDGGKITVTRKDNGAASVITFAQSELSGTWSGTFTGTILELSDKYTGDEGCGTAVGYPPMKTLVDVPFPLTIEVQDNYDGTGSSTWTLDMAAVLPDEAAPMPIDFTRQGETLTFTLTLQQGAPTLTGIGTVSTKNGALIMEGTIDAPGTGKAVFSVTKQP